VVNEEITALLDSAIAGASSLNVTSGNVTLTTTAGSANQARMAILIATGTPGVARNIIAPSQSKTYIVVNQADASVVLKGSATTGVTIRAGQAATCVWNGADFEIVASGDVDGPASATDTAVAIFDGTTGKLIKNTGVTIDGSNNVSGVVQLNATTLDGTNIEVTNLKAKDGTAAGSIADATGVVTLASSVLTTTDINGGTIDGTTIGASTRSTGAFTTLTSNNATTFTANTASTTTGTGTLVVTGGLGVSGRVNAANFDGIVGANTAAAGTFTTLTSTGNTTLGDAEADTVTINGTPTINAPTVITTNSTTNALRITQTGTGNALLVEDSANPDSTPTLIDASGRVVVGNTATRSVGGSFQTAITNQIFVEQAGSAGLAPATLVYNSNDGNAGRLVFGKSRSASVNGVTTLQNNDSIGSLRFAGADGTTLDPTAAIIEVNVDGTPATGSMPGRIVLYTTASGASSPTERMRIGNNGRIGVGTSSTTDATFVNAIPVTGAGISRQFRSQGVFQSDVTSFGVGYETSFQTAAASFTMSNYLHFSAFQSTLGVGSAVTNQFGFHAGTSLTGATNNYGFYSTIASGTGRWNFYAAGSAANYFAGETRVGSADNVSSSTSLPANVLSAVIANSKNAFHAHGFGNSNNGVSFTFSKTRAAGPGAFTTAVASGDLIMFLASEGSDGVSALRRGAVIATAAEETFSPTTAATYLFFSTAASGSVSPTERLRIASTGLVSLQNSGGLQIARTAVTAPAATDGNVFSGTYTPTLTNVTNVDASTSQVSSYMRVGNVVTVCGSVNIDPTAAGSTEIRMSIPVASDFTAAHQAGGTFNDVTNQGGGIFAAPSTDDVRLIFTASSVVNTSFYFSFTYRVI
jgi:hypothetical protein